MPTSKVFIALRCLGVPLSELEEQELLKEFDPNDKKFIDFATFIALYLRKVQTL